MNRSNLSLSLFYLKEYYDSKNKCNLSKSKTNINEYTQRKSKNKSLFNEYYIKSPKINTLASPNSDDDHKLDDKMNKSFSKKNLNKIKKELNISFDQKIINDKTKYQKPYINDLEVIVISDSSSSDISVKKIIKVKKNKKIKKECYNTPNNFNLNSNSIKMKNNKKYYYKKQKKNLPRRRRIPKIYEKNYNINNISIKSEIISDEDTPIKILGKSQKNKIVQNNIRKNNVTIKREKDQSFDMENNIIIMDYLNEDIEKSFKDDNSHGNNQKRRRGRRKNNENNNLNKTFEKDKSLLFEKRNNKKTNKLNNKKIFRVVYDENKKKDKKYMKNKKIIFHLSNELNSDLSNNKKDSLLNQNVNTSYMKNISSDISIFNSNIKNIKKKEFKEDLVQKYNFMIYEINESSSTIILKKIKKNNTINNNNLIIEDFKDNIEILIKTEESYFEDNLALLGHKRKRHGKKNKPKKNKRKRGLKINEEKKKEIKMEKKKKDKIQNEHNIIKDKNNIPNKPNISKNNKKRKEAVENPKGKSLNNIQLINRVNPNIFNSANVKNKKGTKNNRSMKINIKKQKEKIPNKNRVYNGYNGYNSISIKSRSEHKKEKRIYICNNKNNNKNINNINNNINSIKNNYNVDKIKDNDSFIIKNKTENKNSNFPFNMNKSYDFNNNIKNIESGSYSSVVNSGSNISSALDYLSYSFPIEDDDKIQFFDDPSYFSKNSKYIKYNPIDEFLPSIPYSKKKSFNARIGKTNKITFSERDKMLIDNNDNEIQGFFYSNSDNNEEDDLPPILAIPRIKPCRNEYIMKIKNKLVKEGIKIYQTESENMKKEEQYIYISSFILFDEENEIKEYIPCYRNSSRMEEFIMKKNLEIIEFQEDNDIDTDEEQLELEIERNNEAFINFMKKVEADNEYVEKNLNRKKKK